MEFTTQHTRPRLASRYPDRGELSAHRLELLRERITEAILAAAGSQTTDDDLLGEIVRAAMHAFVDSQANAAIASDSVAHLMEQIGARQARQGFDAVDLAASFRTALVASQKGLTLVVGDFVTRDTLIKLRERLVTYLSELHIHAHAGLVRGNGSSRPALAHNKRPYPLSASQVAAGQPMIAIVSISAPIPEVLRANPLTISANSRSEILVPASWDAATIADQLMGQAIASPPAQPLQFEEILTLTRQAAELLRDGSVRDGRDVVPSNDLLAALIMRNSPLLAELTIEKHLRELSKMTPHRRTAAGELLLSMLENGQVMAAAARELGVPRQTVFSRMKPLWALFGDALEDPSQCLELTVALHAALPRWRLDMEFADSLDGRY